VEGTPKPLLAPVKRFLAGAVAGGATENPEKGFDPLGAGVALTAWSFALSGKVMRLNMSPPDDADVFGVALTVWSVALSGNVMRPNRSPPDEFDTLGVATLSVDCSMFAAVVSAGLEIRLKRSLPALTAGCEAPNRLEPPPNDADADADWAGVAFSGLAMASSSSISPVGICDCEKVNEGFDVCAFCQPLSTLAPEASPLTVGAGEALWKEAQPFDSGAAGLLKREVLPEKGDWVFCSVLGWGAKRLLVACWVGCCAGWEAPNPPKLGVVEPLAVGCVFDGCAPNVNEVDGIALPFC
jgi:hypothetical protein